MNATVSVIIPTLNEAACLPRSIAALRSQKPLEIIVADGGSDDGTQKLARMADRWLDGPRGRARQMNAGAAVATGQLLLFLHADCILENGWLGAVEKCLASPAVAAGCFCQRVAAEGRLFRCIDVCATARVQLTGLVYGDQGLFLRHDTFERVGGFPNLPLMEDVAISVRLRQLGRIAVVPKRIYVSPRRWRKEGVIRQSMRNWTLTGLAAAGVSPSWLARFYPVVR
jgi:rSAM/selenodomain-associated transferase 2